MVSSIKQDKYILDGNIQRPLSIQEEGGKSFKEGLDSQVLRRQERCSNYFCVVIYFED